MRINKDTVGAERAALFSVRKCVIGIIIVGQYGITVLRAAAKQGKLRFIDRQFFAVSTWGNLNGDRCRIVGWNTLQCRMDAVKSIGIVLIGIHMDDL